MRLFQLRTLIVTDGRPAFFQEHRIPQPHLIQPASLLEVAGFPFLVHAHPSPDSFLHSAFSYSPPTEAKSSTKAEAHVCAEFFSTSQMIQQILTWFESLVSRKAHMLQAWESADPLEGGA